MPVSYFAALRRLTEAHRELASHCIQVKDVDEGLIDFPARHGEQVVLLCWRDGEDDVAWFHDLASGFAGRRPISELVSTEPADA